MTGSWGGRIVAATLGEPEADFNDLEAYLPDADGNLLVLADCEEHYILQPKTDMMNGTPAVCSTCLRTKTTKTCSTCGETKPVEQFVKNTRKCHPCKAAYQKARTKK